MFSFVRAASKLADTHSVDAGVPKQKLKLMKSPLVEIEEKHLAEPNFSQFGDRYKDDAPEFQRVSLAELYRVNGFTYKKIWC